MSAWVASGPRVLLVIGLGVAGPAALAFDFGDSRSPAIQYSTFPTFIDPTHFVELAAAHKALLGRGAREAVALRPETAEIRRRAEELGWGVHAPNGAEPPTTIAEPAEGASAAWEAAARRAADELAREQEKAQKGQAAAPIVGPPAPAAAQPPSAADTNEPQAVGKADAAQPADQPATASENPAAKPARLPAPPPGKESAARNAKDAPAGAGKVASPAKKERPLAPPSALGAVLKYEGPPSWRAKALPKEPTAFGWDDTHR